MSSPVPLLLLHGFSGSAASWDDVRRHIQTGLPKTGLPTLALDLVGHGTAPVPADPRRYSMAACVGDVLRELDARAVPRAPVLGYSMGGRVALHLALTAPGRVPALILASASPGIQDPAERAARIAADEELARFVEREGIHAFVERWERVPLLALGPHVSDEVRARQRRERLAKDPRGLAGSLRGMGAGQQAPVWDRLGELHMPVLLMVGERDARYRAVAERMSGLLPDARLKVVPHAGHTVHLDQPAAVASLVTRFLVDAGCWPSRSIDTGRDALLE